MLQETGNKSQPQVEHLGEHGLLEQLNLPPQAISFIRNNSTIFKILATVGVVVFLGGLAFKSYSEARQEKSSTLLYRAMQEPAGDVRDERLTEVVDKYSGADAALWGGLQLAHAARREGQVERAIELYEDAAKQAGVGSPLSAIIDLALGTIYEGQGELEKAFVSYEKLSAEPGFQVLGKTSQARVLELQDKGEAARVIYENLEANDNLSPNIRDRVTAKLASFETAASDQ